METRWDIDTQSNLDSCLRNSDLKEQERRRRLLCRVFTESPGHEEMTGRFPHPSPSKSNSLIDQEEVWEHTSSQNLAYRVTSGYLFSQQSVTNRKLHLTLRGLSRCMKTALKHHPGSARPSTRRLASGDHNYYSLKVFVAKSSITESFDFRNYINLICFKSES